MEINRENYQAFLLDKQENSLSSEKEKELEVFFQEVGKYLIPNTIAQCQWDM